MQMGYYEDTLLYCLDDGTALLAGPAFEVLPSGGSSPDIHGELKMAILPGFGVYSSEAPTHATTHALLDF